MRLITYKGQKCWLVEDVERVMAQKDARIAELEGKITPLKEPKEIKEKKSGKASPPNLERTLVEQ